MKKGEPSEQWSDCNEQGGQQSFHPVVLMIQKVAFLMQKALGRFRKEKLVSSKRGRIEVQDQVGLARLLESFD